MFNKVERIKRKQHKRFCNRNQKGDKNHNWRGGIRVNSGGYRRMLKPDHHFADGDGYVMEHRYLFEQYHQCCLMPWSNVHHKNGNRIDNQKENLEGMMNYQHSILHGKKDMSNRVCLLCSTKVTSKNTNGIYRWLKYRNGYICSKCYYKRYNSSRSRQV